MVAGFRRGHRLCRDPERDTFKDSPQPAELVCLQFSEQERKTHGQRWGGGQVHGRGDPRPRVTGLELPFSLM